MALKSQFGSVGSRTLWGSPVVEGGPGAALLDAGNFLQGVGAQAQQGMNWFMNQPGMRPPGSKPKPTLGAAPAKQGGSGSPAPGAPGRGGQEYNSPYAGFRDATFSRIRAGSADGLVQPASGPGETQVPMVSPAARAERARRAEMLGNAGVQAPLPPLEDLKPYWDRPGNQAMRSAATPGQEGFVAPGSQAHSDRADIQSWMEANKGAQAGADGRNIVDRYLLKEYSRGTLGEKGLQLARARGLVKDGPVDYSASFGKDPGFAPADAFTGKFNVPEFASAGSGDIKQWPQQAIAPEQIAAAYQGKADLDPANAAGASALFTKPLTADYGSQFMPGNIANAPLAQPLGQGGVKQFPAGGNPVVDAAILAGYQGRPIDESYSFPAKASQAASVLNTESFPGISYGVPAKNPAENRGNAFADSFLEQRKRDIIKLAFQGGMQF